MIKTREDLIHVLTEAAEIEHNLLCSYLYAVFSIKRAGEGALTPDQGAAVERWRKAVLSVALEEMAHLVCVNNLLLAIGGAAHFDRPNLPVAPGYHPSGIVVRLAPFTLETLQHFIFLERPDSDRINDGKGFAPDAPERDQLTNYLTPSAINYATIGHLYDAVSAGLTYLSGALGEKVLFADGGLGQLDDKQTGLQSVKRIASLESALTVVEEIKEQGEGSTGAHEDSHFDRFQTIRTEWSDLLKADPQFAPAWPAAVNPVMRHPLVPEERVWICEAPALRYLDCGNAVYGFMLTVLQQAYSTVDGPIQIALVKLAIGLMEIAAILGNALTRMPAGNSYPGVNAGMTFAVPRNLGHRHGGVAVRLQERLGILREGVLEIASASDQQKLKAAFERCMSTSVPAV